MSYQVLARKWRPSQFDEVVGQSHVVAALSNALDQDRVHHAFLFTGTRGVGKTTLARIFAKALNCEQGVSSTPCGECGSCTAVAQGRFIDLIEVDAASRTKVDDTRELLDNVQYAPTQGRYKVYLIDEVHMLSTHSFNALLKTLEEPPEHVKFLLATTDPQKLPMTVLSRCIQFSLNAIELPAIEQHLKMILDSEKIEYDQGALMLLARAANGSLRDALSLLDQAIAYSNQQLTETKVRDMLGLVDGQIIVSILNALAENNAAALMQTTEQLQMAAQDLKTALDDLLSFLHALALHQFAPEAVQWKGLDKKHIAKMAEQFAPEALQLYYQITLNGKRDFALAPDPRTGFEMVMLRLLAFKPGAQTPVKAPSISESNKTSTNSLTNKVTEQNISLPSNKQPKSEANLSEQAEPFLLDGLQNTDLQRHLTPASSIKSLKPKPKPKFKQDAEFVPETSSSPTTLSELVSIDSIVNNIQAWSDFVIATELKGMARQLAVHMTPLSYDKKVLKLQIDEQYRNLQSDARIKQILDALQLASGEAFKLELEFGKVVKEQTAAGVIAERERLSIEKTRQAFTQDANIKNVAFLFDGQIEENTIKPIN